jgi:hypothetical protein
MSIKRKSEFDNTIDLNEIEKHIPRDGDGNPTDEVEAPAAGMGRAAANFDIKPQNVPALGNVLATLGEDESALRTDPRALENVSTAPCIESSVILTDNQEADIQGRVAIQATLENPKGMNIGKIPLDARRQLAEIADAMKNLPTADTIAYADNRKIYMAAEVRDVPNRLTKAQALKLLSAMVGEALTAKAVKCAMGTGFTAKPHVWLSQRLAYECSKREIWDKITPIEAYDEEAEVAKEAVMRPALDRLFSATVTEQLMVICKINRISMLHTTKLMIERVCDLAIAEKAPKDYSEKFESMPELEQLIAAG